MESVLADHGDPGSSFTDSSHLIGCLHDPKVLCWDRIMLNLSRDEKIPANRFKNLPEMDRLLCKAEHHIAILLLCT